MKLKEENGNNNDNVGIIDDEEGDKKNEGKEM